MGHSPEYIIAWTTNQPKQVQRVQEGWYHTMYIFRPRGYETQSRHKNNLDRPKILGDYDHPTRE